MIIWISVAVIAAALLLFALCAPVFFSVSYDGDLCAKISYLFWHKMIYPKEKELHLSDYTPKKLRKRRKRIKRKRRIERQKAELRKRKAKKKEKKPLLRQLRAFRLLLHILKHAYRRILSSVHVHIDRFDISVASDDAAKTAILYGVVSQSAAYILGLLHGFTKTSVKRGAIRIYPDFTAEESSLALQVRFSAPVFKLIILGLHASLITAKYERKQKTKNKSQTADPTDQPKNGGNEHE